jgi:mRNA interferase MazF
MKRGEIWTGAGGADYAGKPRPFLIVQDDIFGDLDSIVAVGLTSDPIDLGEFRIGLVPNSENGLFEPSKVMIDKIASIPKVKLGKRIGSLSRKNMVRVNRALIVFLGLAAVVRG